jgi:hypothetical protein
MKNEGLRIITNDTDEGVWDEGDTLAYGEVLMPLGEENCGALLRHLRKLHKFLPSVAEVNRAKSEMFPSAEGRFLEPMEVRMRRVVVRPENDPASPFYVPRKDRVAQIPSSGESGCREAAREYIRNLRRGGHRNV